jgi:hypothetical protein
MANKGKPSAIELTINSAGPKGFYKGIPNGKGNESSAELTVLAAVGGQLIGGGSTTISNTGQTFPTGEF